MKTLFTLLILACITSVHSQTSTVILDTNKTSARINTSGRFFYNEIGGPGYEIPKGALTSVIYNMTFWFAGVDQSDSLHLSAQYYNGSDLFSGPISNNYNSTSYLTNFSNVLWKVGNTEIQNHISNYNNPNYIVPSNLTNWPAHGNIANGESQYLAPFVDVNNNGIYDPTNGDYPIIRGDQAVYVIMNDDAGEHTNSGGEKLKMEFHFMFYQYTTNDYLDSTTFINLRIVNRSQNTYSNFKTSVFIDSDIGSSVDDLVGCDSTRNLMYAFNGTNSDYSSPTSYGINPPAIGLKYLNHDLEFYHDFYNYYSLGLDDKSIWGFMNGFTDTLGTPYTNLQGVETPLLSNINLSDTVNFYQTFEVIPPADRRAIGTSNGVQITPNQSICYDYAVIYNRSNGNNIENLLGLASIADQVQLFFDSQIQNECGSLLNIENQNDIFNLSIFPNPSNGDFKVDLSGIFDIEIFNLSGQKLIETKQISSSQTIKTNFSPGIYIIQVKQNNHTYNTKLIIE